ncbi:response regulator transcription factor [Catellatospora chokoriensis]|uniref:Transcriptional regulator n=1 Tax=Catellatospora chokoriensis TaxID=310353 RepID=A0A8J3K4K7_9ACTN|nr:response regulator transcription factor [Catellatospora chokoriensis]GIF93031.1 transcriptional regulator [Catellatospora chokoriensis]
MSEQRADGDRQRPALLLVEDDGQLSALLAELFDDAGYAVDVARDGHSGLHAALTRSYAVMIIDRGLPAIEGLDLVGRLRVRGISTPIMILTALGTVADRVEGLDAGAEDYLVKPFEVDELLARVRALVRRHAGAATTLSLGRRHLDLPTRTVRGDAQTAVELSGREAGLLQVLAAHPARVFTREELLARVFEDADSPGAVDTYVYYLRRKLGPGIVRTVHGLGYRMGSA